MKELTDILSELDSLMARPERAPDGSFSTAELAEHLGLSRSAAIDRIKRWMRARLVETCQTHRVTLNGHYAPTMAYRVVRKGKKK